MTRTFLQGRCGFTRIELTVIVAILLVIVLILIPGFQSARAKQRRLTCVWNLEKIGRADRVWGFGHSITAWYYYEFVSEDLGPSPKVLICPDDERKPATYFAKWGSTNQPEPGAFDSNTNVSYFVNPDADNIFLRSIEFGDRNLGPGTVSHDDYGYSPANGSGNEVTINGPVSWSLKMHSAGNAAGAGNVLLGDHSVQQVSSALLNKDLLPATMAALTNRSGIRLIFP
jgi:hypothetical protein